MDCSSSEKDYSTDTWRPYTSKDQNKDDVSDTDIKRYLKRGPYWDAKARLKWINDRYLPEILT